MITRNFNLFLNAGKHIPLVINVNQYDHDEQWCFTLLNDNGEKYIPSTGAIVGIKADRLGIINSGTVNASGQVVINETEQMTAAVGKAVFELLIDDQTHGTANFAVLVEPKPGNNADFSESDLSLLQEAIDGTSAAAIAEGVGNWMDDNLEPGEWVIDSSLTVQGAAADAKKVGDEISDLKSQIAQGMPFEVKTALDSLLHKVGFLEDSVDDLAVIHAWATEINLVSISAVFTQGANTIYDTDSLDYLKQFLVVTATYDNGTTATVSTYTLSGELTEGTSVITATYEGKSATFNVTVTHAVVPRGYTAYDYLYYTGSTSSSVAKEQAIHSSKFADLNNSIIDFDFMPLEAKTSATAIIGAATYSGGTADNGKVVQFFGRTDTQRVSCFSHGTAIAVEGVSSISVNSKTHVKLDPGSASPSTLTVGSSQVTGAWTSSQTVNSWITFCGTYNSTNLSTASLAKNMAIGTVIVSGLDGTVLGELIPCVRDTDDVIGIYDTVEQAFHTASTATYATIGNANCKYAVGNWEA